MKKNLFFIMGLLMASNQVNAQITCTETPDCTALGYTKTAAQCPNGGVKCPFNSSQMFCLSNTTSYNFQMQTPTALLNTVYHDGSSTAAASSGTKTPIGLVYHIYRDTNNSHGLIMSLEQPLIGTWAEAKEYCENYVVKGTNVGDWRLPEVHEMLYMTDQYVSGVSDPRWYNVNNRLEKIIGGEILSSSVSSRYYNYSFWGNSIGSSYPSYVKRSSMINFYDYDYAPYGAVAPYPGGSYVYMRYSSTAEYSTSIYAGFISGREYWTLSEYGTNAYYVSGRHAKAYGTAIYSYVGNDVKTKYAHFRCIMSF